MLPVDPVVIVGSTEELDLLKGAGAGGGAGDRRVQAQEGMQRCGALRREDIRKAKRHITE